MEALSDADKMRLRAIQQGFKDVGRSEYLDCGRVVADYLRSVVPDLPDLSIGMVCLALQDFLMTGLAEHRCETLKVTLAVIATAGLDLMSAEWETLGESS